MWIIVAAVVVYVLWVGGGNPVDGVVTALAQLTRGARLTHSPADDTGLVDVEPRDLADQAGASLEAYALARMLSSEEGSQDPTTQAAICWATINTARRRGSGVAALLLRAKNSRNNGYFGTQKDLDPDSDNFNCSDRYASTRTDPYARDLAIAQQCLEGTIADFTGGATNFDRPAGEKNPEQVAANRIKSGLVLADVEGVASGLRFWRPA
jgi:hypothetical protein